MNKKKLVKGLKATGKALWKVAKVAGSTTAGVAVGKAYYNLTENEIGSVAIGAATAGSTYAGLGCVEYAASDIAKDSKKLVGQAKEKFNKMLEPEFEDSFDEFDDDFEEFTDANDEATSNPEPEAN